MRRSSLGRARRGIFVELGGGGERGELVIAG